MGIPREVDLVFEEALQLAASIPADADAVGSAAEVHDLKHLEMMKII